MTFKEAYKILKKNPYCNYLRECCDWGDLWGFGFTTDFIPREESVGGGPCFISKKTGKSVPSVTVFTDPNRTGDPTPIPVPHFAYEGWDYFDDETEMFRLKTDAPAWVRREFAEFHKTDKWDFEEYYEYGELDYETAQMAYA